MAHNPEFLKLVNQSKSRIQETDIEGYKKMQAAGEKPLGKAGEAAQPGTAIAAAHP